MKKILFITVVSFLFAVNVSNAQSTTANNNYDAASFLGWGATSGDLWFKVNNATKMTLQNTTGYLGLGTTSPACKFHLAGTDMITSQTILQRSSTQGWGPGLLLYAISSDGNYIHSGRGLGFISFFGEYNGDANVGVGAQINAYTTQDFSASGYGSKLQFYTTPNSSTTNQLRMVIDQSGFVGIGTTTPGSMLDVKGTLRLSGSTSGYVGFAPAAAAGSTTYTLPSADGSTGQVLQTNGSGTLSWLTPSAGTVIGSGTATRLAFWSGTSALSSNANLYWDNTNSRLGIGTSSPGSAFDVKGTMRLSGSTSGYVGFAPAAAAGSTVYTLPSADGSTGQVLQTNGSGVLSWLTPTTSTSAWQLTGNTGNGHFIGNIDNRALVFKTNNAERMRIIEDPGYVGIGTSAPKVLLQVSVPYNAPLGTIAAMFNYVGGSNIFIVPKLYQLSYDSLSVKGDQGIFWSDSLTGSGGINTKAGFVIAPYSKGYNGIRITSDGNVGIGTSLDTNNTPNRNPHHYKLAVNGSIGAKEVFVEITSTTWPDYVFDKKYELLPLKDVESYININSHLPNVPSACEIGEKGIAVGEMNSVLLKKVEELTLYLIEQNKVINELKEKISTLESKIKQ